MATELALKLQWESEEDKRVNSSRVTKKDLIIKCSKSRQIPLFFVNLIGSIHQNYRMMYIKLKSNKAKAKIK